MLENILFQPFPSISTNFLQLINFASLFLSNWPKKVIKFLYY